MNASGNKLQNFEENLNQVVNDILQDVYAESDDANTTHHQVTEQNLKEFEVILQAHMS